MGIILNKVSYTYGENTAFSSKALENVEVKIDDGEFIAIIGKTGSGKSTLIQMMNGLIKPTHGEVYYNGEDIWDDDYNRVALRGKVGLVFQYPEHQLFESSVIKDVMFGPKNIGMNKLDIEINAYNALKMVGVDEKYIDDSPLDLSGGLKRRVAIAGILAMKPEIIILDEPCAGLDPAGRTHILDMLREINEKENTTIIIISHSMEDVSQYAKRVLVMSEAKLLADGPTKEVLSSKEIIESSGLKMPAMVELYYKLQEKGILLRDVPLTQDEAYEMIKEALS